VTGTHSFRLHDPRLATLDDAIDWLRERWDNQRTAPVRLTQNDTEGELGGLRYSGAFAATLTWTSRQSSSVTYTVICSHPMSHGRTDECPECQGSGVTERNSERYPYPMSTALTELRRVVTRRGQRPALSVIYALAAASFRPRVAMQLLGCDEAVLLGAIRQLFHHYQAGPVISTSWVDMSDSQRSAITAGEVASTV
jgi:hypothetical protein